MAWRKPDKSYGKWYGAKPDADYNKYTYIKKEVGGIDKNGSDNTGEGGGGGRLFTSTASSTPSTSSRQTQPYIDMQAIYLNNYNQNMAALTEAYNRRAGLLETNLNNTYDQINKGLEQNKALLGQNTTQSLQDAYVNMMISQRDTPQMLSAMGFSGGMSESTMAGIRNNYGNSRNQIALANANSLADIMNQAESDRMAALQRYSSAMEEDNMRRMNEEMSFREQYSAHLLSLYS